MEYDVLIVGASFSGLTLAQHLPKQLKVLVVDAKPAAGSTVESTGLITSRTYQEFQSFFPIEKYITNPISAICVVAPNFEDHFVSTTEQPWIYQTDTKALVKALAETVPDNVEVRMKTVFQSAEIDGDVVKAKIQSMGEQSQEITAKFLVGADGGRSKVASVFPELDQNKNFLFGYEQVFLGEVTLGPNPEETIYHFWFGDFSLGYGGWLSPTVVDGKKAFRIGLAKLMHDRGEAKGLMLKFMEILREKGMIQVEGEIDQPGYIFGSMIPIGGSLKRVHHKQVMLIGDAAGFCGAFAADGIKGSVISGKEGAQLIERYLQGEKQAPSKLRDKVDSHNGMMKYYRKQVHYRWIWDQMRSNRTFRAMYDIIEAEKETFLNQFCDSKDTKRSLAWTVLKVRHIPKLIKYSLFILWDMGLELVSPRKKN